MPERNVELLQQTMQYIKDHPEQHMQDIWVTDFALCGTAACFAGWASLLDGMSAIKLLRLSEGIEAVRIPGEGGRWRSAVSIHASSILGLTREEADILFGGTNTTPTLELMVKDLVNGDELRDQEYYEEEAQSV